MLCRRFTNSFRSIILIVIAGFFAASLPHALFAQTIESPFSNTVTATIPDYPLSNLNLISPPDDSATNTAAPIFIWTRPTSEAGISYSNLFIDDSIFAATIDNDAAHQDFLFYSIDLISQLFYLTPYSSIVSEGYHSWYVTAYGRQIGSTPLTSSIFSFYVDTIPPFISLDTVDGNTYNWRTDLPASIPSESERTIETGINTTLQGQVETSSNIRVSVICPPATTCTDVSQTTNATGGTWGLTYYNMLPNEIYTVQISATDAGGNITFFPVFYIVYRPAVTPTPTPTATPSITITTTPTPTRIPTVSPGTSPLPTTTPTPTPSPIATPSGAITPTVTLSPTPSPTFVIEPPPKPTPPLVVPTMPPIKEPFNPSPYLLFLMVIGLPTHLLMSAIGCSIGIDLLFKFFYFLLYPFFGKKDQTTIPFSTIKFFDPSNLTASRFSTVSDIKGLYRINFDKLSSKVFVIIYGTARQRGATIIDKENIGNICFYPNHETHLSALQRLPIHLMKYRSIPLGIAVASSLVATLLTPNIFFIVYLYFSLQSVFSEYIYPKIK